MQLYNLSYITTIIECKNLTKAASELNMTQTALSKAVARLEDELGYPLFERSGRNIIPTVYGLKFYEWARKTTLGFQHLLNEFDTIEKSSSHALTVAFDGMYSSRFLLSQVYRKCPQLNISEIYYNSYDEFPHLIYKSHIDCVLSFIYYDDSEKVNRIPLMEDSLLLILPASSAYARYSTIKIEDIKDISFIFPSENNKLCEQVGQAFSALGYTLKIGSKMYREHLIYELAQGAACSFISRHTLSALGASDKFVAIKMDDPGFERHLYLYWRKNPAMPPAFNMFLETLTEKSACDTSPSGC